LAASADQKGHSRREAAGRLLVPHCGGTQECVASQRL